MTRSKHPTNSAETTPRRHTVSQSNCPSGTSLTVPTPCRHNHYSPLWMAAIIYLHPNDASSKKWAIFPANIAKMITMCSPLPKRYHNLRSSLITAMSKNRLPIIRLLIVKSKFYSWDSKIRLKADNSIYEYYSVQTLSSSRLLSKNFTLIYS